MCSKLYKAVVSPKSTQGKILSSIIYFISNTILSIIFLIFLGSLVF